MRCNNDHLATRQRGFTLVELVMVIVIIGVIGAMVSVFMKSPIDAYLDSARRAALTDVADTTVRRMARDIRKALPNSIRTPNSLCVEFIPTKTGGRYRLEDLTTADNTGLDFSQADTRFNMLGNNDALPVHQHIGRGDWIVVYNLGIAGSDAYELGASSNRTSVSATAPVPLEVTGGETAIPIDSKLFPLASASNRFHVVPADENVVSYVCDLTSGTLYRTVSTFASASGNSCPVGGAVLARDVSACSFDYSGSDLQRNALVNLKLQISNSGETVSLQYEVHVNNTP